MFRMDYKEYYKKSILNTLIGHIVWSALSTYVIISKGYIGESNIPIFETILFMLGIITSKYITSNKVSYRVAVVIDVVVDLICLVSIFMLMVFNGVGMESAIALYVLIILTGGVTSILIQESQRDTEDKLIKSESGKRFLKLIRGKHRDFRMYGMAVGGVVALLLLTYLHIDLKIYGLLLLSLNILQVAYDSYLIKRYLFIK